MSVNVKRKIGAMSLGAVTAASMFGFGAMPVMADSSANIYGNMSDSGAAANQSMIIKNGTELTNRCDIRVGKTLYSEKNKQTLQAGTYEFTLERIQAQSSSQNGPTAPNGNEIAKNEMPMPSGATGDVARTTVEFSAADVANKNVVIEGNSFGEMTFTKAGYYMYEVKETAPSDASTKGINYDKDSYYVVVYVIQDVDGDGNTLPTVHIENITSWHQDKGSNTTGTHTDVEYRPNLSDLANVTDNNGNAPSDQTDAQNGQNAGAISGGITYGKVNITQFINGIESRDIEITKNVKGVWGDLEQYFKYTVTLTGLNPGTTYVVEAENNNLVAGVVSGDNNNTPQANSFQTTFTAGTTGEATYTFWMKDDGKVTIKDLPVGATYTVKEDKNDHDIDYAVTNRADSTVTKHDTATGVIAKASDRCLENNDLTTGTETVDISDGIVKVAYTNTRDFATVTGLPEMTLPFGVAGIGAAVAALLLAAKRRREDGISMR